MGVLSSILGHLKRPYFGSHQIYMKKLAGTFSVCFFFWKSSTRVFFSNLNHGSLVETAGLLAVLNWFCVTTSIFRCFFFPGLVIICRV